MDIQNIINTKKTNLGENNLRKTHLKRSGLKNITKSAGRLKTIVSVFAKYGFKNILEKATLGKFILDQSPSLTEASAPQRLRMAFEELGPVFIKLGQLLSTRTDLIPVEYANELRVLQDNANPLKFNKILHVLESQFGDESKVFRNIIEQPLASASIAQVHMAQLHDGSDVVIKIRRPDILKTINEDLNVLYIIANLLEKYIPEAEAYNPNAIVDEFFKTLELETNFIIEANNIQRFQKHFKDNNDIKIPEVYFEHSSEEVLVMEMMDGIPLSKFNGQKSIDPQIVAKRGIELFFRMVFEHRFFHGDLHAGNLFILPNNTIGLVDFGVVGRLDIKTRDSIANMFIALSQEDYEALAMEFIDLSHHTGYVDINRLSRELRDLISPYFGLSFKNVNQSRLLLESAGICARNNLKVPAELMLFFKSIVTIEGLGRQLVVDFDLMATSIEISESILKSKYDTNKIFKDASTLAKDSLHLIHDLPRQLRFSLKKMNQTESYKRIQIDQIEDLSRSIDTSSHIVFLGMVISSLIIGGTLALAAPVPQIFGVSVVSSFCFAAAMILGVLSMYNYFKR